MSKIYVLKLFLVLAIANVQCGIIIIVDDDGNSNSNIIQRNKQYLQNFEEDNEIPELQNFGDIHINDTPDLPDPKNVALMARYIVHSANWTSIAYTSHSGPTYGQSLAALFAVSDGPVNKGSGVPYFYVSRLQSAVVDLQDSDNRCSLMMSLAETDICTKKGWDPEDPRCAHVVMTGTFHKLTNKSREYVYAVKAVFSRHPGFIHLPESHHFFLAKFNVQSITIQDAFGGPSEVSISDYFNANSDQFQLVSNEFYSYDKNKIDENFDTSNENLDDAQQSFYSVFNI